MCLTENRGFGFTFTETFIIIQGIIHGCWAFAEVCALLSAGLVVILFDLIVCL